MRTTHSGLETSLDVKHRSGRLRLFDVPVWNGLARGHGWRLAIDCDGCVGIGSTNVINKGMEDI